MMCCVTTKCGIAGPKSVYTDGMANLGGVEQFQRINAFIVVFWVPQVSRQRKS
jgi:hypothetical protein